MGVSHEQGRVNQAVPMIEHQDGRMGVGREVFQVYNGNRRVEEVRSNLEENCDELVDPGLLLAGSRDVFVCAHASGKYFL